jgi:hypothetical protein
MLLLGLITNEMVLFSGAAGLGAGERHTYCKCFLKV